MKNLRKTLLLIPLIFMTACGDSYIKLPKPDDWKCTFWIGEDVTNVNRTSLYHNEMNYCCFGCSPSYLDSAYEPASIEVDEFGETYAVFPMQCVTYDFDSFPDLSSPTLCVTCITITDPNVTVYGLSLNSSDEEIKSTMKANGYKKNSTIWEKYEYKFYFSNEKITICTPYQTNREGVVY